MSHPLSAFGNPPTGRGAGRNAMLTGLSGECGTIYGLDTRAILADLGVGEPLPRRLREDMEAEFNAAFDKVCLHNDVAGDRLAEFFGAEAFTIHEHIVFRRDRFQPDSGPGRKLLRHELAHALDDPGPVRTWLTRLLNSDEAYSVGEYRGVARVAGNSHYDLTERALQQIGGFGPTPWSLIRRWAEEIDSYKRRMQQLGADFPELRKFGQDQLHSHAGVPYLDVGMSSPDAVAARLTHTGVIGKILRAAIEIVNGQRDLDRGFKLLGVALHTLQDYFSHHVPIHNHETGPNLCTLCFDPQGAAPQNCRKKLTELSDWWKLEDDATLDPRRWRFALDRSKELLWSFRRHMDRDIPNVVWKAY